MIDFSYFFDFSLESIWSGSFLYFWQESVRLYITILNVLLSLFILYILIRIWPLRYKMKLFHWVRKPKAKKFYKDKKFIRQWNKVINRLSKPTPESLRIAVIDADSLVDVFLKKAGYMGEHMADRLSRIIPSGVKSLSGVWDAHLLRNSLVHIPGSTVSVSEAKTAVKAFEKFLKELGAIPD